MKKKVTIEDIAKITDSIVLGVESDYLIIKNRQRCKEILNKKVKTVEDLIDGFIYLHIVLEAGLNGFFRNISLSSIKKGISELEITKNLDEISFIHKTILFIYNSRFEFNGDLDKAEQYHVIIGKLKQFASMRNMLLHGHAIKMVNTEGTKSYSRLSQQLTPEGFEEQLKLFEFILEGLQFYFSHLETDLSDLTKKTICERFLDYSWIH